MLLRIVQLVTSSSHDITEKNQILLKVALNTITITLHLADDI